MQPLRIAHVLDAPFTAAGANGVSAVVQYLARAQSDIGQSVAVFSGVDGVHVIGPGTEPAGRPRSGPARPGRPLRRRFTSRFLDPVLAEAVRAWQPDVVHFHSVHVALNVALAERLRDTGLPYCVTAHGALFPAALRRARMKKAAFRRLFERRFLREASFVHAVSPHEVGAIRGYGFDGPVVIAPNGVPAGAGVAPARPDALYAAHPSLFDRNIFMFVGRLDPWQKGLDLLIEAFARAALHNAVLVLVGPDCRGSRRSLRMLADRLGILPRVLFTGAAFGEDRANLFAAADVFVHPSRWEGLSLSVLAAAAAGKPC
ncbi:MAG: glycosyltransferase, partial [Burkholderiales bacterium]